MIKQLHPTLKACKCGWIGKRSGLYRHFTEMQQYLTTTKRPELMCVLHGESVLNVDDPRLRKPSEAAMPPSVHSSR